jgi:signal transduction histidine kinase
MSAGPHEEALVSSVTRSLGSWWSDRRSLRWKLPLLLVLTATAAVAIFGFVAHGSVRRVALDTAGTRLRSALSQLRTVQELGVVNQLEALRRAAHDSAVVNALRIPDQPIAPAVLAVLNQLKGVSDSNVVVELLDRKGKVRHAVPAGGALGETAPPAFPPDATIGPIEQRGDKVAFESTVTVANGTSPLGAIRVTRQLRNGVNRRMVANLVEGAVLLVGNREGDMWGDAGRSRYPDSRSEIERYVRHGERWVSVSSPVRGTPWLYAVELPERMALAPARALILPFTLAGLFVAAGAALIGLRVSQRITEPLAELTLASEAMARGETGLPALTSTREDEIGRLARAFSTMAQRVMAKRDTLEREISQRTGELSVVTGQLSILNEELRESEKLATLGRLSGSVGHELRNPLGVMSNIVFLIDAMPDASQKLKDYSALLREQIRVSDRIISDLLERARSGEPLRTTVDVRHLIDETLLRAEVPDTVTVNRQVGLPHPLILDRDHLAQILWNLVRNAIQAMDGVGTLTILATHADDRLRIEVRDTGKGITDADAERVFQPMYTTKAAGIGLGLSVSRAFARANGGDLYAIPGEGGARFVLEVAAPSALATNYGNAGTGTTGSSPGSGVRRESPPRMEAV